MLTIITYHLRNIHHKSLKYPLFPEQYNFLGNKEKNSKPKASSIRKNQLLYEKHPIDDF
jgi:hypothetical protein